MKAILIDDERLALDLLEHHLEQVGDVEIVGSYTNPIEGKKHVLQEEIDVVFLDINLPEILGIELAEQILEDKPQLLIVFITAYNEYATEAFDISALDYIIKPIKQVRLKRTVTRLQEYIALRQLQTDLNPEKPLQISVGNQLAVKNERNEYETIPWRTTRAREIFLYLLQSHGQLVRKSTLLDMMWPDFDEARAYSQLYSTIYLIRRTVSTYKDHLEIKNVTEGYILKTQNVRVDLFEWEKQLTTMPAITIDTAERYTKVMQLYRGDYLAAYDYLWAEMEKHRLEEEWLKTAFQIADVYYEHDKFKEAETWYDKIYQQRPELEEASFSLMKIYAKTGNNAKIYEQYSQLMTVLEELDIPPSRTIKKWYQEWNVVHEK